MDVDAFWRSARERAGGVRPARAAGRRQPRGGPGRHGRVLRRARAARPGDRAGRLRRGRAPGRRGLPRRLPAALAGASSRPDEAVGWAPRWALQKVKEEGERRDRVREHRRRARPEPLRRPRPRARRAARSMPELRQAYWHAFDRGEMPWTIVAFPTPGWAEQAFGEPDVARLWDAIRATVRLDEPDPVAAWREHIAVLQERARAAERARLRRGALPRPGHRPDRRAAATVALDGRGRRDRVGAVLHAEPADRGGLHDARPAPDRGSCARDAAARARRRDGRPRPRDHVQRRPDHAASRPPPARTRCAPRLPSTTARRTSARSRSSTRPRASAAAA